LTVCVSDTCLIKQVSTVGQQEEERGKGLNGYTNCAAAAA